MKTENIYCINCKSCLLPVNLNCKSCCNLYILLYKMEKVKKLELFADRSTKGTWLIVRPR